MPYDHKLMHFSKHCKRANFMNMKYEIKCYSCFQLLHCLRWPAEDRLRTSCVCVRAWEVPTRPDGGHCEDNTWWLADNQARSSHDLWTYRLTNDERAAPTVYSTLHRATHDKYSYLNRNHFSSPSNLTISFSPIVDQVMFYILICGIYRRILEFV